MRAIRNWGKAMNLDKAATWLLGGFAVLTASLSAIGIAQGEVQRMLLDSPGVSFVAFALVGTSIPFAGAALVVPSMIATRLLLLLSLLLFSAGLVCAIWAGSRVPSTQAQPHITAEVTTSETGGLVLVATVKADGIRFDQRLRILVHGLVGDNREIDATLYDAELGRNPGNTGVETTFHIVLTPGEFDEVGISAGVPKKVELLEQDCFDSKTVRGCVVVRVPESVSSVSPEEETAPNAGQ